MSCKPKAKSLRAADGMELMTRFGKSIRAADGFGMPMNTTPMSAQNQGAFDNIQGMPATAGATPAAGAAPKILKGIGGVSGAGMLNSAPQMAMPTLQLAEGGDYSIRGIGRSMGFFQTPAEKQAAVMKKFADQDAAYKAKQAAAPAPAAPAAPAPAPTQGISGYVGNGALDKRMAAAGLRNGGDLETGHGGAVPGSGSGDKIPAKYEPGEFVVSNDMLDAQPELRGHLRGLREAVLAAKGMTVQQADAKAVSGGGGLRAMNAAELVYDARTGSWGAPGVPPQSSGRAVAPYTNHVLGNNAAPMMSGERAVGPSTRPNFTFGDNTAKMSSPGTSIVPTSQPGATGYKPNFTMGGTPPPAHDFDLKGYTKPSVNAEGYYESQGRSAGNSQGVQGRAGGPAGQTGPTVKVGGTAPGVQAGGAGAGSGGRTGVLGSVREGLSHQPGPVSKSAYLAGRVLSSPLVGFAGRAAGGAGVVQNFNDYKLNDPDVDSSAAGTWNALRDGEFSKAGRSLSKGALETGMDLGSFAANTADLFVPGTGPSQAYNKMLRDHFGDQLVDNSGNNLEAPATAKAGAPSAATPAPQTYPQANAVSNARQLRLGDPSSSDLNDEFSNAMIENRNPGGKVTKIVGPNGKVSYSGGNVSGEVSFQGADGNALRGRPGGGYMSVSGGGADTSALNNPDGTKWSASDNAIMAANLRDGVDKYRGTSRDASRTADKYANMPIKMAMAARAADVAAASARENAQLSADTSLRTTGMNNETSLMGNKMTNAFNMGKFRVEQANKDREFARDTANDAFTQGEAGTKSFMDHANSLFQTQDKDGKMIPDTQKTAAYTSAVTDTIGHLAAQYANSSDPKQRAYAADLAKRGPAALDAADRAALPMLFERQQLHAASTGISPFASGGATSKNLLDYTDAGQTSTGWQQRRKLKGGQEIPESNLRYGADANHLMPNWGSGSNYLGAK